MIPEITELSIVMLGSFNPAIFHPSWLLSHKLIDEEDFKSNEIEVINPFLAKFKSRWLQVEVTNSRCQLKTTDGTSFELLRDLNVSIFKVLRETPINAFGINVISDYQLEEKQYEKAGNILAPFSNWKEIFNDPKLLRLEIVQERRMDEEEGSHRIRLMPSMLVKPHGLRIDINSHFEVSKYDTMDKKLHVFISKWEQTLRDANIYAKNILTKIEVL